jgi:hypothetical protein
MHCTVYLYLHYSILGYIHTQKEYVVPRPCTKMYYLCIKEPADKSNAAAHKGGDKAFSKLS